MILLLLSSLIGLVSVQFFTLNFSIQGLNRAIICTPIELMYKSVLMYGDSPLFKKDDFENIVLDYYSRILTRYVDKYDVEFYYYNFIDESMCLTNECDGVEITVTCKINLTYDYSRTMYYELKESKNG